jgi:glyoxylase-like metal-dependent hydrolase (beta-lactamase superfamily II)
MERKDTDSGNRLGYKATTTTSNIRDIILTHPTRDHLMLLQMLKDNLTAPLPTCRAAKHEHSYDDYCQNSDGSGEEQIVGHARNDLGLLCCRNGLVSAL